MSLLENEAVAAPEVAAPAKSGVECTRDSDCPVNDCENCS